MSSSSAEPRSPGVYRRRQPEATALYQIVQENLETFLELYDQRFLETWGELSGRACRTLRAFLRRGILWFGFARVHCGACGYDRLVGFSCKRRGCPSCNGRRMNDGPAFLTDQLIGDTPVRHWVLSLPHPLRYVLAYDSAVLGALLKAFTDSIFQFLRWRARSTWSELLAPSANTASRDSSDPPTGIPCPRTPRLGAGMGVYPS